MTTNATVFDSISLQQRCPAGRNGLQSSRRPTLIPVFYQQSSTPTHQESYSVIFEY